MISRRIPQVREFKYNDLSLIFLDNINSLVIISSVRRLCVMN